MIQGNYKVKTNSDDLKNLKINNRKLKTECMDVIDMIDKHIDEICRVQILAKKFKRKKPAEIGKDNEILHAKSKEAN